MDMTILPTILQGPQASPVLTPASDFRLNEGALIASSGAGLGQRRGGVLPGSTMAGITLGTNQITVAPFQAHIPGTSQVDQGGYTVTSLNNVVFAPATTLPASGSFKKCRVIARVYDSLYDSSGKNLFTVDVIEGAQAATLASAQLPNIPVNAISLLDFSITSGGVITTIATAQVTGLNSGIRPTIPADSTAGVYPGEHKWDPSKGTQEWVGGAAWARHHRHWGFGTSFPTGGLVDGDMFFHSGLGCTMRFINSSTGWRQAEIPSVQSFTARNALRTNYPDAVHDGFLVRVMDFADLHMFRTLDNRWTFTHHVPFQGTTDGNGILSFVHNGGGAPFAATVGKNEQASDALNTIVGLFAWFWDATVMQVRATRSDNSQYLAGNPVKGTVVLRF